MAIAVNLFPLSHRGMAIMMIMMCGRIGGFVGSVSVGLMLECNCTLIFYLFGATILSECIEIFHNGFYWKFSR